MQEIQMALPAPPWNIIEHEESFEVQAAAGQHIAYIYFDDEPKRRDMAKRLSKEQARAVAEMIVKLHL